MVTRFSITKNQMSFVRKELQRLRALLAVTRVAAEGFDANFDQHDPLREDCEDGYNPAELRAYIELCRCIEFWWRAKEHVEDSIRAYEAFLTKYSKKSGANKKAKQLKGTKNG